MEKNISSANFMSPKTLAIKQHASIYVYQLKALFENIREVDMIGGDLGKIYL